MCHHIVLKWESSVAYLSILAKQSIQDQNLGEMLLPLLLLLPMVLGAPYEPGNPGAPWTEHELLVGGR